MEGHVRYEAGYTFHTNTVEGFYSIFKRGMKGVYQHCAEHHLHRYLAEFDFRYSNRSAMGIEDGGTALGVMVANSLEAIARFFRH